MLVVTSVLLPLFFVFIMSLLEQMADDTDWRALLVNVGFDMCVLALGVTGGVFSNQTVMKALGPERDWAYGTASFGISFGAAVVIARLKHGGKPFPAWKTAASLLLGGIAVGFPTLIIWR